jgi:hypothetical protein
MHEAWKAAADRFALVSLVQHVALYVVAAVFFARGRSMERIVDWCLAAAFATSAAALLATPGARAGGALATALAALWARDARRPVNRFYLAATPRPRLVLMAVLAAYGAMYPGYAEGLPAVFFSPYGVLLQPTLLVALATANSGERTDRVLHWALAATGLSWGIVGAAAEGLLRNVPLLVTSAYAVPIALGVGGRRTPPDGDGQSMRAIRDRMYGRWTLLPGPKKPRYGRR